VILNSVVQYFPGTDYLLQALAEAVRVTRPGGQAVTSPFLPFLIAILIRPSRRMTCLRFD
jgi:ubiquinone/menaquinone biosynthesis C-methylase UbiE